MARKKIYYFDGASIPETMFVKGVETPITGVFISYSPRAMFCRHCGFMLDCKDRRESVPSFEGIKCPECGTEHTANSVLAGFSYIGSNIQEEKVTYSVRKNMLKKITTTYKLASTGENLFALEKSASNTEYFPLSHISARWVPKDFKKTLIEEYGNKIDPMVKLLIETDMKTNNCYTSTYFERLDQVKDIIENHPTLFVNLLDAFKSDASMRCDKFEDMYPEYLLPLTAQLIKDYNPIEDRNRSWSKPYQWNPVSAYTNYEALTCVVSYYKSGLISHHVMRQILEKTKAFKNPTFIPSFKANYLQFNGFLDDLIEEGKPLESTVFDIKAYYARKTRNYFIEQGYTGIQIDEALANTKHGQYGLDFLNAIGSTRRKKTK